MLKRFIAIFCGLIMAGLLSGCSANFAPGSVTSEETPIGTIQGNVHGGNLPVTGAEIYLFAAGQGGYGTSAKSLIKSGASGVSCSNPVVSGACYVTTDSTGNFSVGGDYTCTEGQQVYMVSVGGNPGLSGSINNAATVQMAALAACPASGTLAQEVPYLVINEVTTVAFAYSVGGFATNAYNVSSDASGETALANAFANANNIVNLGWGQAPAVVNGNPNSVNPQSKINALANILVTCVNTAGSTSSQCANLFKYATNSAGTAATDEASAIFNIVHNQTHNVQNIYNLTPSITVFQPTLSEAPADWTMPVVYKNVISKPATTNNAITGGPYNLAFDANGTAWIGDRVNGVVEIGAQGAVTTYSNSKYGFKMVKGVAVSPQDGSIWVTDFGSDDVYVMSDSGAHVTTVTQHLTSNGPVSTSFALNPAGGNYLAYELTETVAGLGAYDSGTYVADHYAYAGDSSGDFAQVLSPGAMSVDNTGAPWMPSTGSDYVGGMTTVNKEGTVQYTAAQIYVGVAYTTVPEQMGTAADGLGNVWAAATISSYGTALYGFRAGSLTGTYTGGGLNNPYKTFVDGSNSVWIANAGANTVSAFNNSTGTWLASAGFSTGAASGTGCVALAVDPSGNVWTANSDQSVTQLLGVATPTAAPLYGGSTVTNTSTVVTNGNLGTKP